MTHLPQGPLPGSSCCYSSPDRPLQQQGRATESETQCVSLTLSKHDWQNTMLLLRYSAWHSRHVVQMWHCIWKSILLGTICFQASFCPLKTGVQRAATIPKEVRTNSLQEKHTHNSSLEGVTNMKFAPKCQKPWTIIIRRFDQFHLRTHNPSLEGATKLKQGQNTHMQHPDRVHCRGA